MKESEASIVCVSCFDNWVTVTYNLYSKHMFAWTWTWILWVRQKSKCVSDLQYFFHFTQMFGKVHSDEALNWADIINVLTIFFVFDCPRSLIGLDRSRDLNNGLWLVDVKEIFPFAIREKLWWIIVDNRNPNSIAAVNKIPPLPPLWPGGQ